MSGVLVSGGHELEEQVRRFGLERDVADLVKHQQWVAPEANELAREASGVVASVVEIQKR